MPYLWSHEFGCTAKCACTRAVPHFFFAETVIGDLYVPVQGQHYVIEFEVAINDTVFVEVFQCQANLGSIESVYCLAS